MDIQESVKDRNNVGFRILKKLLEDDEAREKNLVFSPLSIYMMLTLLAAGASKGQLLLNDLLSFLNFKSIDELNSFLPKLFASVFGDTSAAGGPFLTTANGVWIADDLPVKPSFQNLFETLYQGKLNQVDFINKPDEVVMEANAWVEKETRGLIPEILTKSSINRNTKVILANSVYFKAQWSSQIEDYNTKDADFHLLNGSSVQIPFMRSCEDRAISVFDGFKVASLSYDGGDFEASLHHYGHYGDPRRFSMLIFLPNDRDGLPSLMKRACSESEFLERHQPRHSVAVGEFKIPKFKFGFEIEKMKGILKNLGLESLFMYGSGGFAEMVEDPVGRQLYVSKMFHKAVIAVDEKGTEAAGVTVCDEDLGCSMEIEERVKFNFVADHPFMFVIMERKCETVLFMGQVLDPSSSKF